MLLLGFFDIDGVFNDHRKNVADSYTLMPEFVEHGNMILDSVPDMQVVLSSSWRQQLHLGNMTLAGLEFWLLTHGLKVRGRLHGVTGPKDDEGHEDRTRLIEEYVLQHNPDRFVAIDDRMLIMDEAIQTGGRGLTWDQAALAVHMLTSPEAILLPRNFSPGRPPSAVAVLHGKQLQEPQLVTRRG